MKSALLLFVVFFAFATSYGQTKAWDVKANSFFDNTEFGKSTVTDDQTMAGIRLAPAVGLAWNKHRLMAGVDVLHEYGSNNCIDAQQLIAYYRYASNTSLASTFYMGAFPRKEAIGTYPRVFFQDSINYYRPIVNGMSYALEKDKNTLLVWLDWTGKQSSTERETFFVGLTGRLQKKLFFVQHYSYLMHYAKMKSPPANQFIHDNSLMLNTIGMDLSTKTACNKLEIQLGWLMGLEDNRGTSNWLQHNGLFVSASVDYKRIGLTNSFYYGEKQFNFYPNEGNKLYWGNPFYRLAQYNRTDISAYLIQSDKVNAKLVYSLHSAEKKLFHEQALIVSVLLNNYTKE